MFDFLLKARLSEVTLASSSPSSNAREQLGHDAYLEKHKREHPGHFVRLILLSFQPGYYSIGARGARKQESVEGSFLLILVMLDQASLQIGRHGLPGGSA